MHKPQEQVREFHLAAELPTTPGLKTVDEKTKELRLELIREEQEELRVAMLSNGTVEIADALADLLYVVYGTAEVYGLDMEPIFDEVQRSNMSKVSEGGKIRWRYDGKILKPPTYSAPALENLVLAQK